MLTSKQLQHVYANANAPPGARIAAAFALFGAAIGELFLGLFYIALVAFALYAIGAALLGQDVIGALPDRWRGLLLGALFLAVFAERLGRWAIVVQTKAAVERVRAAQS